MSLVTRCPKCRTLFRVTPAQLQTRAGQVRCGRCMLAFDGFQALAVEQSNSVSEPVRFEPEGVTAEDAQTPETVAAGRAQAPDTVVAPAASGEAAAKPTVAPVTSAKTQTPSPVLKTETLGSSKTETAGPAPKTAGPVPKTETAGPAPKTEAPAPSPKPVRERVRSFISTRVSAPLAQKVLRKPSPKAGRIAVCVALGVLLGVQAAYAFRSQLAARYPGVRSVLTGVCDVAGCSVSLPQRPDLVKIEASDVHMIDPARPALIQLTATLRSYATYDLAYPALDLVLTNANEHALARRVFVPEEYLDQTRDPKTGIPPRAEITLAIDLDTGDLNAAGFRLDLLAAPAP